MGATRTPATVSPTRDAIDARLRGETGSAPRWWSNGPGHRYGWHVHDRHKVLHCAAGGVVFHTDGGDLDLEPGDRLDVEAGTRHAATVGARGVRCAEATR